MAREVVQDAIAVDVVLRWAFGVGVVELEGVLLAGVVGDSVGEDAAGPLVTLGGPGVKLVEPLLDLGGQYLLPVAWIARALPVL